jgi:imidazolonepropionase-like amidohydrolase
MPRSLLLFVCLFGVSLTALAYVDPPPSTITAFKGATIHTAAGPKIESGVLVIDKGVIVAVGGADTPVPDKAKVVDLTGKTIIPGLVDSHSHIGIFGRPNVTAHGDGNEGSGAVQSSVRALDSIWPDDPGIRMAVAGGITTANIMPGSGNVIGGQTVYVKLRGTTIEAMRLTPAAVLGGLEMANGENPKSYNFGRNKSAPATRMKLAARQRAGSWERLEVRAGEKGPVVAEAISTRVETPRGPGECLVVTRSARGEPEFHYRLSNAGSGVTLREMVRAGSERHRA